MKQQHSIVFFCTVVCLYFTSVARCQSTNTALVSPKEAVVVLSLDAKSVTSTWEWNAQTSVDGLLEYEWSASLSVDSVMYTFGLFHFKPPRSKPAQGDFIALTRASQLSLFRAVAGGSQMVKGIKFAIGAIDQKITIRIIDEETKNMLFSSRPTTLSFTVKIPGLPREKRTVSVQYVRELPGELPPLIPQLKRY